MSYFNYRTLRNELSKFGPALNLLRGKFQTIPEFFRWQKLVSKSFLLGDALQKGSVGVGVGINWVLRDAEGLNSFPSLLCRNHSGGDSCRKSKQSTFLGYLSFLTEDDIIILQLRYRMSKITKNPILSFATFLDSGIDIPHPIGTTSTCLLTDFVVSYFSFQKTGISPTILPKNEVKNET